MAVWWVDPFIEASVGGIHGTVDGTTRNGTYSYPFMFSDVCQSAIGTQGTSINGNTVASGDEIRFKSLANREAFLIDLGSTWYNNLGYRIYDTNTSNTALSSAGSSWPTEAGTWGNNTTFILDPNVSDQYLQPSTGSGFKPLVSGKYARSSDTYWYMNYGNYSNTPVWQYTMYEKYYNSSTATCKLYLLDPDYYIPYSSYLLYFCTFQTDIKVTDGWTSETTRDGYLYLRVVPNSTSSVNLYWNNASNSSVYSQTWFDMPDTAWDVHQTTSNSPTTFIYYSAGVTYNSSNTYVGGDYTQKRGAVYGTNTYGAYAYDYTQHYAPYGAYPNDDEWTFRGGYIHRQYMGQPGGVGAKYGKTILNAECGGQCIHYGTNDDARLQVGSWFSLYGSNGAMMYGSGSPNSRSWLKMIDGSYYYSSHVNASIFTNMSIPFFVDSVDALRGTDYDAATHVDGSGVVIYNGTNDSHGNAYPAAVAGFGGGDANGALVGKVKYAASTWWNKGYIMQDRTQNTDRGGSYLMTQGFGVLDTEGSDYTTSDGSLIIASEIFPQQNSTSYLVNPGTHFSTNTYDGKPVTFLHQYQTNSGAVAVIGYNNDSGGFCIQSNPNNNGQYFGKDIEIVLPTYDPSSQNIRLDFKYRYETLNGNGMSGQSSTRPYYYYRNSSGGLGLATGSGLSEASTAISGTTSSTTITGSSMAQGDDKLNHIIARLYFRNYVANTSTPDRGRLVIMDVSAVTV